MRDEVRQHDALAQLASDQHGVVSHGQLLALGYSTAAIGRAVVASRIHRVHRGVYAIGHPGLHRHAHSLAAVLACGRDALLSHESAAWLWGLHPRFPKRPDVTMPARGHRRSGIRIHHSTILNPADRALQEQVPVTAVPRTLLDLAATVGWRDLRWSLERAERFALLDLHAVDSLLARSGGHGGRDRLRDALAVYRDPVFARSGPERRFLALVLGAGLPRPAMNIYVAGHELDAYWEPERLAVEIDAYATHGSRSTFERDRVRQEELMLAGIDSIRVTAQRLEREPDKVVANLRALLAQRRRELGGTRKPSSHPRS